MEGEEKVEMKVKVKMEMLIEGSDGDARMLRWQRGGGGRKR